MDNKTLAALFGGLALLCVTAFGISFVVSGDSDEAPAPTVSQSAPSATPTPTPTSGGDEFILDLLEQTWNKQSYSDQQSLCTLFNYAPDQAWNAFDNGSDHLVPEDVFMTFFGGKCASIT